MKILNQKLYIQEDNRVIVYDISNDDMQVELEYNFTSFFGPNFTCDKIVIHNTGKYSISICDD